MLVHARRGWEIPERDVTPESVYRNRRWFLQTAVGAAGSLALAGAEPWENAWAAEPAPDPWLTGVRPLEAARNQKYKVDRPITRKDVAVRYNNFYEFSPDKVRVWPLAQDFKIEPWEIEVKGQVEKNLKFDASDLLRRMPIEERVYRFRCVEAWSMVIPWVGFPMKKFIEWVKPLSSARYVRMVTFHRPGKTPGVIQQPHYAWPYHEGLTMAEAMNPLTMLVVGMYGQTLPKQNGAPLRLIVPWKYGFKSIKSIVRFEFTKKRPPTFWNRAGPDEYGFTANVNPKVPHPRWSQASERVVETGERITTLPYNGYGKYVEYLYE